jgi:hypothetical protein
MTVWDWPGDSREDRAKRVAQSYRELLVQIARGEVSSPIEALFVVDEFWREREQYWLITSTIDPYDDDDWINATDAADYVNSTPKAIRHWAERGHIRRRVSGGNVYYSVADMRAYEAEKRRARALSRRAATAVRTGTPLTLVETSTPNGLVK